MLIQNCSIVTDTQKSGWARLIHYWKPEATSKLGKQGFKFVHGQIYAKKQHGTHGKM